MVYTRYQKQRILHLHLVLHLKPPTIINVLEQEGIIVSRRGVFKFLKRFHERGTTVLQGSQGVVGLVSSQLIVEDQMRRDDETTAYQLHFLLNRMGYILSLRTILRCRTSLGWTFRGSSYCQLIRAANKVIERVMIC